jgi:hypothetical protein
VVDVAGTVVVVDAAEIAATAVTAGK